MHDDELAYFDADRRLRREGVDAFVRLRVEPGRSSEATATPGGVVTLTDGQRLAGEWGRTEDDGQTLVWRQPLVGEVRLPLERLRSVRFTSGDEAAPAAAEDVVILSNGDALHGFVPTLGDGAGVTIEHQGQRVVIPRERVRTILLGNPPIDPPAIAGRHLVRFRDGSRLLAAGLAIASDRLRLVPELAAPRTVVELPLGEVASIDFVGSGWRLVDLADQPMEVRAGGAAFGLALPPRWEAGVLRLHAPVRVAFTLPAEATRAAAVVELQLADAPAHLRDWADLIVRFGPDAATARLTAAQPTARLTATAGSGGGSGGSSGGGPGSGPGGEPLELVLDEGVNGPILDRVTVRNAAVLIRRPIAEGPDGSTAPAP